jgi:hypothetical protein
MKSALVEIPEKYFTACKVIHPFRARVSYEVFEGKIGIMEIAMSPEALRRISNMADLVDEIENDLRMAVKCADSERKAQLHPLMEHALKPFVK